MTATRGFSAEPYRAVGKEDADGLVLGRLVNKSRLG
jgi:hypothetical protein